MKKPLVRVGSNAHSNLAFVPADAVSNVLAQFEASRTRQALKALRKLCPDIPQLPPFEIV